jgi:hypothetical protein
MSLKSPTLFTHFLAVLKEEKELGLLVPPKKRSEVRFREEASEKLLPALNHLTQVLLDVGLEAQVLVRLEDDLPCLGLSVETYDAQLWLSPGPDHGFVQASAIGGHLGQNKREWMSPQGIYARSQTSQPCLVTAPCRGSPCKRPARSSTISVQ